jgi:hypothetical protein
VAFNDIYRLRIHQRVHGGEVLNVLHFVDDTGTPSGAGDLAADFRDNMQTTLRARCGNDFLFEFVEAVKIVPYGEGPETAPWAANTVGTVAALTLSGTLCEVITIYTSQIGRRHRGRLFMAGAANGRFASGAFTASQTTATQAFATALAARYTAPGHPSPFSLGVWSKVIAGPDPPWPTSAFTRATSLTVRTLVRNQRRRQIGVGR